MKYVIPAALAIGVGLVTLFSYFLPNVEELMSIRLILTNWAAVLAGLAILIGIFNLVLTHFRRIQGKVRGSIYSMVTVVAAVGTVMVGAVESLRSGAPVLYEDGSLIHTLFIGIIATSQAALASLVMFFLVVGAARMLKTKPGGWTLLFLSVVVVTLVGWIPLNFMGFLNGFRDWIVSVPALAGARGILLGIALGTVAVGLRVLVGAERPYKD
ncbi:MAG: hypothetical protein JXB07_15325 [Anaerolineae bacterium]|nr:hypothetical protein [Anaerolineae bacterium]